MKSIGPQDGCKIVLYNTLVAYNFHLFESFSARLTRNFAKKMLIRRQKNNLFSQKFSVGKKNLKFEGDMESIERVFLLPPLIFCQKITF